MWTVFFENMVIFRIISIIIENMVRENHYDLIILYKLFYNHSFILLFILFIIYLMSARAEFVAVFYGKE